jgi:hypothetical protein
MLILPRRLRAMRHRQIGGYVSNPASFTGLVPIIKPSIPFILTPNYTSNGNGDITLPSLPAAAPRVYPNAYCFFSANTIVNGTANAAGFYYCQFITTTHLTVFNNLYSSGVPQIPAAPTAFVGAALGLTGASNGPATAHNYTVAIPMSASGWLDIEMFMNANRSAAAGLNGVCTVLIGGATVGNVTYPANNADGCFARGTLYADGKTNSQVGPDPTSLTGYGSGSNRATDTYAIDFTQATLNVQTQLAHSSQAVCATLEKFSLVMFT